MNTGRAQSSPLWRDLLLAARSFRARILEGGAEPPDLSGAAMAHYHGACRHWGTVRAQLTQLCAKPPSPRLTALLAVAMAALAQGRWARPILVHQAVEAARRLGGDAPARFVNAVLQRAVPSSAVALPPWIVSGADADGGSPATDGLAAALLDESRMVVRWLGPAEVRDRTLSAWRARGLTVVGDAEGRPAHWLHPPTDPRALEGYAEGWFRVQNIAPQRALEHLELLPGQRVLDACAAPGGKTFLCAERPDLDILALDVSTARLERMDAELRRLSPSLASQPRWMQADVREFAVEALRPGSAGAGQFDVVLLDVPCTGLGTLGRHPEVVWRRGPQDLDALLPLQAQLLRSAWSLLRPGGQLLYMNCSLLRAEGEDQIRRFMAECPAERLPALGQLWPTSSRPLLDSGATPTGALPQDGFYFASLRKLA